MTLGGVTLGRDAGTLNPQGNPLIQIARESSPGPSKSCASGCAFQFFLGAINRNMMCRIGLRTQESRRKHQIVKPGHKLFKRFASR